MEIHSRFLWIKISDKGEFYLLICTVCTQNEEIEIVRHFVYLGSVINPDGDCNRGIRRLRHRKASVTKLDKILKFKDVSLGTKERKKSSTGSGHGPI